MNGITITAIIIMFISLYSIAFEHGFNYAKDIALGIRKVKPSKDFMKGER